MAACLRGAFMSWKFLAQRSATVITCRSSWMNTRNSPKSAYALVRPRGRQDAGCDGWNGNRCMANYMRLSSSVSTSQGSITILFRGVCEV